MSNDNNVLSDTLLDSARKLESKRRKKFTYTQEQLDVVVAWLVGEIGVQSVTKVIGISNSASTYVWLAIGAKEVFQRMKK